MSVCCCLLVPLIASPPQVQVLGDDTRPEVKGLLDDRKDISIILGTSSVGVNDDLPSRKAGVTMGPSDHKASRRVEVEDGLVIHVLGRDYGLDHMLQQVSADLLVGDVWVVLGRNEDGVHSLGDHCTGAGGVSLVLNGDLSLGEACRRLTETASSNRYRVLLCGS